MIPTWGNSGGLQGALSSAGFIAPLKSSAILSMGIGNPTFVRATTAYVTDFEALAKNCNSGEIRFTGARRVENLIGTKSEDATADIVLQANSTQSATNVALNSVNASYWYKGNGTALPIGTVVTARILLSAGTKSNVNIRVSGSVNGTGSLNANLVLTSTPTWYSVTTTTGGTAAQNYFVGLDNRVAGGASDTGAGNVNVWACQIENVTGQSNQNPSEYASVGVLSTPFNGAGIDGVKYFPYQNGNTVASNVVIEAQGVVIAEATLKGYLPELAATQILATADIRDMTTANWTLGATLTRARTSVGADGVSNSATRLTSTGAAATAIITYLVTAAATSRTYSALVRRVTGTGVIRITQDNFATNTDITSLVPADGAYHLVQLTQNQLNAVMGFKLDTNTDAIDVDLNQFEAGGIATSRMVTTGAARNTDVESYPTASNIVAAQGSIYLEYTPNHAPVGTIALWGTYNAATDYTAILHDGTNLIFRKRIASTNYDATIANTFVSGTTYKMACTWGAAGSTIALNGTMGTPHANTTAAQIAATMQWGANGNNLQQPTVQERGGRIWQTQLSDAILKGITA